MLYFVKISDSGGIFANYDKAKEYIDNGFKVYSDETMLEEVNEIKDENVISNITESVFYNATESVIKNEK